MAVNRPLATILAAVALVLAIVAAMVVLDGTGTAPPPVVPAGGEGGAGARKRAHAHAQRERQPGTEEPVPQDVVPPTPLPERLPALPGSGFVLGTIVDAVNGEAVMDVDVRLRHPTGEEISRTRTDHAGRYQFEAVPETLPLVIQVAHAGHLTGLCCDVRVGASEILRKDVALLRSPRVTLHLTAMPQRRAAAKVLARLMDGPREVARGMSDEFGAVELSVPEQGRFDLRVGGDGWAPLPAEEMILLPGRGDIELRRNVMRGGGLVVRVGDGDDEPVAGATVTVRGRGLEPVSGVSDSRGEVTLGPFLPELALRVVAEARDGALRGASPARAREGHDDPVSLTLQPTGRVEGVVIGASGQRLSNARVEVVVPEDKAPLGLVTTSSDGRFVVGDLPTGEIEVIVRAPGHVESRLRASIGRTGKLRISMAAAPSGTLLGRVLGPRRAPVRGARVRLVPADLAARTGADGSFEIEGVPPDQPQRLMVEAEDLRVRESARADRLVMTIAADQRLRIEVQMEPAETEVEFAGDAEDRIRSVTGRIVRATGAPVASAIVGWAGLTAVTDEHGRFALARPDDDVRVARPMLTILPPAGLLEPTELPLARPDETGLVALDDVGLLDRPNCLLDLRDTPGAHDERALSFAVLLDTSDHLLGSATEPFASRRRITYDGMWLHVAAPGSWRRGGHRVAWVGVTSSGAPAAAAATWPSAAGFTQGARPGWKDAIGVVQIPIPRTYRGGTLRLRLVEIPDGLPLERLGLPTEFDVRASAARVRVPLLLRGVWQADLAGPEAGGLSTLRSTIRNGRARGFRPAR